jgi:hypothetical protein
MAHMGVHRARVCLTIRDSSPLRAELVRRSKLPYCRSRLDRAR